MEENITSTTEINRFPKSKPIAKSVNIEEMMQTSLAYMDRKRKLQAEELGIPPPKHKWSNRSPVSEYDFSSSADSKGEGVYRCMVKGELSEMSVADESEQESAKDSNSFTADADSTISVSNEAEVGGDQGYFKECSDDQHFTSSVDWGGRCSKHALSSLESRLAIESSSDILESPAIGEEHDLPHHDTGLQSSMNYEDPLVEFGGHEDCSCSECRTNFEECTDKELEEMLYSSGLNPNKYVLSSGRWTLKQDAQQGTKKLTIDKEFEEYFSMLML